MIIHLSCQWSFHSPKRLLVIYYEPMIWYVIYIRLYTYQQFIMFNRLCCIFPALATASLPSCPCRASGRSTVRAKKVVGWDAWPKTVERPSLSGFLACTNDGEMRENAGKVCWVVEKMRKMLEHVKLAILSDASEFTRKNVMGKPKAGHPNFSRWQVSQKGPSPFHPMA